MSAFLAILASVAGIGLVAASDPKRGRAAGERRAPTTLRGKWAARALIFGPGIVLIALADWTPFAIWIGAISVIGWGIAAMPVGGWARAAEWQRGRFKAALGSSVSELGGVAAFGKRALDALSFSSRRIKELEARIEALEAKVLTHESREENAAEREAA